jgi:hypothetical protein
MNNTDRDRVIETLLGSRHADEHGNACMDAESLAAWIDGGLSADARARVEHHAADCARCQALLASMARTAPPLEDRPWWRSAMAKWVVPIAAVATAVVVWVAVERDSDRLPPSQTTVTETAKTANEPSAPVAARREAVPSPAGPENSLSAATAPARRIDNLQPQGQGGAGGAARGQTAMAAPLEPVAPPAPSPAPLPPPPAATSVESSPQSSAQSKSAPQAVAETVIVTDATASRLAAREVVGGIGPGIYEIASPNPNYRWRIVPPASIQRSTDGGRTWAVVDPVPARAGAAPAPASLTGGASPALDVCWIVGRNGVVLLSTDGATWHPRPIPESLDLTSVRATDATHAVVTTTTGRQFSTADGGMTWIVK